MHLCISSERTELINLVHFIFMDMAQEHEIDVELVVVRHGETESNRTHTIQGHLNTPLSDVGLQQAERLAKHIGKILVHT